MYVMDTKLDKRLYGLRDELSSQTLNYLLEYGNSITQNKRLKAKGAVSCFILNTFYKVMRGINKTGITLDSNHYSKNLIINGRRINRKVSYTYTKILLDFLHDNQYIILHKGGVGEYGMNNGKWQAISYESGYIEITEKLVAIYKDYYYQPTIEENLLKNVIIYRDDNGIDKAFRLTESERTKKENTIDFNKLSIEVTVKREDKTYDVQLHKVLKGDKRDKCARSYMSGEGIQSLSKQQRAELTINGNDTVIYDYQGFEPSIAYSMCQEVLIGDPYKLDLEGYDEKVSRSLCKLFLLIMFNIRGTTHLTRTLNSAIKEEFDVDKLYDQGKIPSKRINTKQVVSMIEDKHYLIKHMFYGNFSSEPMYIGSLITDYVTDYFTQRGILVLPVFDEFIIEEEYEDELVNAMVDGYQSVLGFTDNCIVRKEK